MNGIIVDGSGNPWFKANIAIEDGRISAISRHEYFNAERVIDASGLIVAPGFIDIHSHSDVTLLVDPLAESKVMQGVTLEVVGNCGSSAAPVVGDFAVKRMRRRLAEYNLNLEWSSVGEYLSFMERRGVSVNVAMLVGHGQIRSCVMGFEAREPTLSELEEMKLLLRDSLEDGAFGMSSGLVYAPGRFAKTDELVELCRVVAEYNGLYATHIRGERETIIEAVSEALYIAEKSGVRLQLSHHPPKIGAYGKSVETLKMIEDARGKGLDVACDFHPYTAGSTSLSALLPAWAQEGGFEKIIERLKDPVTRVKIREDMIREPIPGPGPCGLVKRGLWNMIFLSECNVNKDLIGKSFDEIARLRGKDPFEAYFDILLEENLSGSIIGFYYDENDIRNVAVSPYSMVGSDGYALAPRGVLVREGGHPRSYSTFPMVIRKYVRGESRSELLYDRGDKIMSLETAIMKMTSLPASRLNIHDRGLIRVGFQADICIFDYNRISDLSTYYNPQVFPVGVEYVIVNGVIVVDRGRHTGAKPGKVLRHRKLFYKD
ncbi:amidohydrolase family protein [Candidatus Culexarchaeum yellowstonense]|uniref:N-acyl-D-amino-acid deacylase family protein n=1 Tax=Candidatus Culexarchaeum yellowstonense TaxID=2928963 RepID=UPI0026F229C8|nr:D-aminoacylase [Candidatus Culexarchaeum yellowstonense]